jgi:hypothetical protein
LLPPLRKASKLRLHELRRNLEYLQLLLLYLEIPVILLRILVILLVPRHLHLLHTCLTYLLIILRCLLLRMLLLLLVLYLLLLLLVLHLLLHLLLRFLFYLLLHLLLLLLLQLTSNKIHLCVLLGRLVVLVLPRLLPKVVFIGTMRYFIWQYVLVWPHREQILFFCFFLHPTAFLFRGPS